MSKIPSHIKYNQTIWMYAISRVLERTAFYGMRSILVIYMINGMLSLPESTSFSIYSWVIHGVIFAGVLGAILGDFVLGNRKALLAGSIVLCLGLFLVAVPNLVLFYIGIGCIILGCGFYTPNLMARYGKQFYNKTELTDGGFSVLYLFANLGGILGATLVNIFSFNNFSLGFIICGIAMIGSTIIAFLNKDTVSDENKSKFTTNPSRRAIIILGSILIIGFFWYLYDASQNGIYSLQNETQSYEGWRVTYVWNIISTGFILPLGIILAVVYSFFNFSKALKITVGFILAAISFALLLMISLPISDSALIIITVSFLLLNLGEMIMAPVLYSLITQKANPKYLALIMSLSFLPVTILRLVLPTSLWESKFQGTTILQITSPLIATLGIIIFIVWLINKRSKTITTNI